MIGLARFAHYQGSWQHLQRVVISLQIGSWYWWQILVSQNNWVIFARSIILPHWLSYRLNEMNDIKESPLTAIPWRRCSHYRLHGNWQIQWHDDGMTKKCFSHYWLFPKQNLDHELINYFRNTPHFTYYTSPWNPSPPVTIPCQSSQTTAQPPSPPVISHTQPAWSGQSSASLPLMPTP